jgi:hypothetical protein
VHERRIAADEIDADFDSGTFERFCKYDVVVAVAALRDERDRRHRDAFVDDRDAVLALDLVADRNEPLGLSALRAAISMSGWAQLRRLTPIVIVRMSRFSICTMRMVSMTS